MRTSTAQRRQDFSAWLRTGRWPDRDDRRELELKFNPWHDPNNGRFTDSSDRSYGSAKDGPPVTPGQNAPPITYVDDLSKPPIASVAEADAWRTVRHGK